MNQRFISGGSVEDKNPNFTYNQKVYWGLLYQEAVGLLRSGQFKLDGVLNHVALADAIDTWVEEQYIKKHKQ